MTRMLPRRGPIRAMLVPPTNRTFILRVGPWQIRAGLPIGDGRYSNGSRWHSRWHRWAKHHDC
jgi:hypothetical protein